MKKKAYAIIFFLLASLVTSVYAEENNQNRWYMGTKMGWSNVNPFTGNINIFKIKKENILDDILSNKLSAPILGLFLGYQFNPYFSLEVENNTNGFFPHLIFQKNKSIMQHNTMKIATKLSYPIIDELNLYTKLGGEIVWNDLISKNVFTNIFSKDSALSSSLSLGAEYVFNDSLITRLDYNWKNSFKNIINHSIKPDLGDAVFSIGWKFGKSNTNDIFSSYDPEFLNTQYSVLNENITFPFDSTELKPNAYDKLNKLSEDIRKMKLKDISIILLGHTDKIGNKKYNQKLSEDRAYSIKNYLTSKGFSRDIIIVRGVGELYSLTDQVCNDIDDKSLLISCLAPDRRVEIEVLSNIE
ncbi:OmpA family protein [Buchnera aphidicola]|uniref:Outer membrane protein A n=1 Tax=Buchnera aphidicola str. Ua (Uroleucon ambrosiae) TaxID=1005057 RepID=G2LPI7_BUCUM|nr:OmpA family protein [Buchnera aphidicola]AEO08124.1 outer membrane protein A precursor [Buchnera aphidicola str. Ua (Uroleucon ambrosiae)]